MSTRKQNRKQLTRIQNQNTLQHTMKLQNMKKAKLLQLKHQQKEATKHSMLTS